VSDIYKNPISYYIGIPVVVALWPLLVWGVYSPKAGKSLDKEKVRYEQARPVMMEILKLDSSRLEGSGSKVGAEFEYARAVEQVASACSISSNNYKLSSRIVVKSGKQKTQGANVDLKQIDITRFAKFLSTIQVRWADLQCNRATLTKKKNLPDAWDVSLEFKYYY